MDGDMIARRHPEEILENTEKTSNFLIIPIGEFDDTESCAAVLAKPSQLTLAAKAWNWRTANTLFF